MREQNTKLHMSALLPLVVFALFAVCVLSVLLTGANVYQRLTQRDRDSYQRAHRGPVPGHPGASGPWPGDGHRPAGHAPALAFSQEEGGEVYTTWVYCHDGWLMELYAQPDSGLGPEDGRRYCPLNSWSCPGRAACCGPPCAMTGGSGPTWPCICP